MVCDGSSRARLSASAVTNMVWRSGEKIGDVARFSARDAERVASRLASSSVARCNFFISRQSRTSLVTEA